MGQTQSTADVQHAVDQLERNIQTPGKLEQGTKLYKYIAAGQTGNWELVSSNAKPNLYDAKEDSSTRAVHDYYLEVESGDIDTRVDQDLRYVVDLRGRRITFSANGSIWALKFPMDEEYRAFAEQMNDYLFYNTYGVVNDQANRAKELGEDYAAMFFNTGNERQFSEPMEAEAELEAPSQLERLREEQVAGKKEREDDVIHGIVMGAGENNYLIRGTNFDVLQNVPGAGVMDRQITFSITPKKGHAFTPSKALLAHGERRMNLLTPENKNMLHHADIETGKIVSTWKFQKDAVDIPIKDITTDNKAAQMEERSTFLGLDSNRLCRWDLRDPHGVVQESPVVNYTGGKDYARNTNFTCMATSGDGYVAVGSQDGKIRLYGNKTLTKANTSIPGLGAPITAIDVTYDGKWVLATTDHYLMVVKTAFTNDKGDTTTGFSSRMGSRGSMPRLLRLKPEDWACTGGKPLTKGKFTWITEQGHTERWIVANCGQFSVVWNFHKVKTTAPDSIGVGGLPANTDYYLTAKDEEVVETAFVHPKYSNVTPGKEYTSMVVATPHSIFNLGS